MTRLRINSMARPNCKSLNAYTIVLHTQITAVCTILMRFLFLFNHIIFFLLLSSRIIQFHFSSPHSWYLLSFRVLSILALICFALIEFFLVTMNKRSVSHFKSPIRNNLNISSSAIYFISLLKLLHFQVYWWWSTTKWRKFRR